jgi:class 3 adenylate cyclase
VQGVPEVQYARNGDLHIAYQTLGEGPFDLVFVAGFTSHCEHQWLEPSLARSLRRMASFSRLIWVDKRGTGLSDPVLSSSQFTLEQRMEDLNVVLDAVGSERAAFLGASDGGAMAALYAATYPERVSALVLHGAWPRFLQAPDYPIGMAPEMLDAIVDMAMTGWGKGAIVPVVAPSMADDERFVNWWAQWERLSTSPGSASALVRIALEIDIRNVLPSIRVPTLVMHRVEDQFASVEHGRYLAEHIAGAKLVELAGRDHPHFVGDTEMFMDELEEFLTGNRQAREPDRMLATILFTDIVGSTQTAAAMGDQRWRDLLESHNALVRREIERFHGREIDTAGDGFLIMFDGPARAIRCAEAIALGVSRIGIEIRAGIHTGEVELREDGIGGIAVHIGARVVGLAGAGEVLVSRTVKDLVAGSGIAFIDRGTHALKGVPDVWQVFQVDAASLAA